MFFEISSKLIHFEFFFSDFRILTENLIVKYSNGHQKILAPPYNYSALIS